MSSSSGVNLENYLIPLWEINSATENFSQQRCIGSGGFGEVYKGQLSERWQNRMVAIKRLGQDSYQGEREFRNELEILSRFYHENIISFIGYCDEDKEMILVYDYARNGSLDHHLGDPDKMRYITWTQRLKICLGAAKGLNYLHSGLEEHNRVIHRDVKSANILLDEMLVAKVCDFGLSKLSSKNLQYTKVFTRVAGTEHYVDPAYQESGILKKESDVYSFGVVMFEMLSGMLVYNKRTNEDDRQETLMTSIRRHDKKELFKLIDPNIKVQIHVRSFDTFKDIAYQCIRIDPKDRPTMETVIERIEEALSIQEQIRALVSSLSTAKKSQSLDDHTSERISDASINITNDDKWDEHGNGNARRNTNDQEDVRPKSASLNVLSRLAEEFEQRSQVFADDAKFLVEVKSGQSEANLNPDLEYKRLKQIFDVWKKDYDSRLRETKVILDKLGDDEGDGAKKKKKKWFWKA